MNFNENQSQGSLEFFDNFKGSSGPSHFHFEIDVGKSRIRHRTLLKLNDASIEYI